MKQWKCPSCKREKTTEDNIVKVVCLCGEYYQEVKNGKKEN